MPTNHLLPVSYTPETYLGDGVYASFDGDRFTLDLRGQEPTMPITKIVLEPAVLRAFQSFVTLVTEDLGS